MGSQSPRFGLSPALVVLGGLEEKMVGKDEKQYSACLLDSRVWARLSAIIVPVLKIRVKGQSSHQVVTAWHGSISGCWPLGANPLPQLISPNLASLSQMNITAPPLYPTTSDL